jgi:H+/Cl- antiporter ClcA
MKRRFRIAAAGFLVLLAAALVLGIVFLYGWGGNVELSLMVFGDQAWVTLDAGRPRVWFLLLIPGVFLGAAFSLYPRRSGE